MDRLTRQPELLVGRASGEAAADLAIVAAWLADRDTVRLFAASGITTAWSVGADTDGALLLVPLGDQEPGFAIVTREDAALEVLVADPDRPIELGPFASLDAALRGITTWLVTPRADWIGRA